ncbi:MAG: S8/S53 family peptidase [Vulcanimicrobiota bacterium]
MAVPIGNFGFFNAPGPYSGPETPLGKPGAPAEPITNPFLPGGDTFVAGGYPANPPAVPPGFTPVNFIPKFEPGKLGFTPGDLSQAGSLVVVDQFIQMPIFGIGAAPAMLEQPHGHLVSESAKGDGYQGNLIPSEYMPKFAPAMHKIAQALNEPDVPADEFKKRLDLSIGINTVNLLETMSERLEGLKEAGLHHSAVNLSYGASQAGALENHYLEVRSAWSEWQPVQDFKKPLLENYARAFGLDSAKLMSQDPKQSGPERARLQQALADRVSEVMNHSPAIQEARQHYATAVQELEANHNSVVVSASNGGQLLERLARDRGEDSPPLKLGPKFFDNVLATPETTVVGATAGQGQEERVAAYSSDYQEVDVYADGRAPLAAYPGEEPAQGTSFASPKVAGVMSSLHKLYPEKSSAEIEAMLKDELSHQLLSYDGRVERPVLNQGAHSGMLSRYT